MLHLILQQTKTKLPQRLLGISMRGTATNNFSDPDSKKPTLEIDPFGKAQRLKRPISPHLTIYQPQLTWYMSAAHRILGAGAAGTMSYAVLPMDTTVLVETVHSYPAALVFLGKLAVGGPVLFHSFNGFRHLMWDTANGLSMKSVYNSGYIVLGLTAATTLGFALFY